MARIQNLLQDRKKMAVIGLLGVILTATGLVLTILSIYAASFLVSVRDYIRAHITILLLSLLSLLVPLLVWKLRLVKMDLELFKMDLRLANDRLTKTETRLSVTEARLWTSLPGGTFKFRGKSGKDIDKALHAFFISIYPVTNEQYKVFVDSNGYEPPANWNENGYPRGKDEHPVVYVSLKDAKSYCRWLSEVTGEAYRLPSECEWERAARGANGQKFPWGGYEFDEERCNSAESEIYDTTPVNAYENGRSPCGCYDIVGNVSEWTGSTEDDLAVVRGSSYVTEKEKSNCHYGIRLPVNIVAEFIGFRIVREANRVEISTTAANHPRFQSTSADT